MQLFALDEMGCRLLGFNRRQGLRLANCATLVDRLERVNNFGVGTRPVCSYVVLLPTVVASFWSQQSDLI